jgi:hypothetical protein
MLEILDVHLKTAASPEIYNSISQAFDLFEEFGLTEYTVGYEDILLTADNEGASESVLKVCSLTSDLQDTILAQLRIDLVDEASVSEANTILLALKKLESTEYFDNIIQICDQVPAPEEALAEILSLVCGVDEERLIILLQTVDTLTIAAIKMAMEKLSSEHAALLQPAEDQVYVESLKAYKAALDDQWLYIYDLVEAGEPLGQPYAQYHREIIDQMEARQRTQPVIASVFAIEIGVQLFAGALISCDGSGGNLRDVVMVELEKTYGDTLDRITPIYTEINSLLIKFQAYREAGIKSDSKVIKPSEVDRIVKAGPGGGVL